MEIALVLGLLVAAIILFSTERVGVDVVTGLLLVVLVVTGICAVTFQHLEVVPVRLLMSSHLAPASPTHVCSV